MRILVLNGGSSSIKFSIYATVGVADQEPRCLFDGELSGIGQREAALKISGVEGETKIDAKDLAHAIEVALDAVAKASDEAPDAVGHRVVHPGPKLRGHQKITDEVLRDLEQAAAFAPLHDPEAVQLIRAAMKRYPGCAHYACFDTVFHETMPEEAFTYPLPATYRDGGVRRYGFHGLSCESIVRQMRAQGESPARLVIAHLGSGCSVTALQDGQSIDTSMGMTPTGGVVMGTRSGDLDPGLVLYLLRQQQGTSEEAVAFVEKLLNHGSGISALSEMPNDVRAVRSAAAGGNREAELALKVFTRSVTKAIGGYSWLLGGLDAIVFAGGIGEHDLQTRSEILAGAAGLGVDLEKQEIQRTDSGIQRISTRSSRTKVFIVPSQEDLMIALHVERMANQEGKVSSESQRHDV
jgi:acetate kinase